MILVVVGWILYIIACFTVQLTTFKVGSVLLAYIAGYISASVKENQNER